VTSYGTVDSNWVAVRLNGTPRAAVIDGKSSALPRRNLAGPVAATALSADTSRQYGASLWMKPR
jgi:hypothetical protein